jgi:hypothetical protein
MGNSSRAWINRAVWICTLIGTVGPGAGAIWLFAEAAMENGSRAGNILRVGLGAILLLISLLVLGIGAIYLKSAEVRSGSHRSPSDE